MHHHIKTPDAKQLPQKAQFGSDYKEKQFPVPIPALNANHFAQKIILL